MFLHSEKNAKTTSIPNVVMWHSIAETVARSSNQSTSNHRKSERKCENISMNVLSVMENVLQSERKKGSRNTMIEKVRIISMNNMKRITYLLFGFELVWVILSYTIGYHDIWSSSCYQFSLLNPLWRWEKPIICTGDIAKWPYDYVYLLYWIMLFTIIWVSITYPNKKKYVIMVAWIIIWALLPWIMKNIFL